MKRNLRWDAIRSLGNSLIARMSIVIPLIGYLILFNDELIEFLSLTQEIFGERSETVGSINTRLYLIYFGLTCFGIGQIIYQFYCPDLIKRWGDSLDYVREYRDHISDDYLIFLARRCLRLDASYMIENEKVNAFDSEQRIIPEVIYKAKIPVMHDCWHAQNKRSPKGALISAVFYYTGLLLLAIPSIEAFIRILASFSKHLLG